MIVYHATKRQENLAMILATEQLLPGRNVGDGQTRYVHLSKTPFVAGSYALDVIGPDTNEAWIITCDIPDDTVLLPDPSGEGEVYDGEWVVHEGPLMVRVISLKHVPNVQQWEAQTTRLVS